MEELALDIFRTDDFSATTMTDMVGDIDYVPGELESRNIFVTRPIRTETVTFIKKDRTLELVPTSERGTPEPLPGRQARSAVQIETPRLAMRDRINAREAANLLNPALPIQLRLDNANALVAERQGDLVDRIRLTREYHRFGALQGKILDADGVSVVADFFELFDIPEPAEIALDIANTADGELRQKIESLIVMPMRRALKGRWTAGTRIHALVGDAFWADLWKHAEVREAFRTSQRGMELLESRAWTTLEFGGVVWEHWYDQDYTDLSIGTDKARFFPVGAYDTFFEFLAPGEDWEEIGSPGRDLYSVVSPDYRPNMHEWTDVYVRTYPLYAMKAPQALMSARRGA
jgi:hypothetical protein